MNLRIDLSGQTFGQLKALERLPNRGKWTAVYKCQCMLCGNIIERSSSVLTKFNRDVLRPNCGCNRKKRDMWEKL
jgi:hypothetical protein